MSRGDIQGLDITFHLDPANGLENSGVILSDIGLDRAEWLWHLYREVLVRISWTVWGHAMDVGVCQVMKGEVVRVGGVRGGPGVWVELESVGGVGY